MIDAIEFMQANGGAYLFLIVVILFFCSAKSIYEGCVWILDKLNIYHNKLSEKESKERRLEKLEKMVEKDYVALESLNSKTNATEEHINKLDEILEKNCEVLSAIKEDIKAISKALSDNKTEDDKFALAMCRNTMDRLYKEAAQQGFVTKAEFEAFESLKDIYLSRNGNAYFKHHLIPEFEKLPIKGEAPNE